MGDNSLFKALALATQLGFAVAGPLVVFIAGGVWADNQLHTTPWLFFLGLVLGLVSAAAALYQLATTGSRKNPKTTTKISGNSGDTPGPQDSAGTDPADSTRN